MKPRIYLDNNASSPLDPRVLEALLEDLQENIGNPSSVHFFGQKARARLQKHRCEIASYFNARPQEIIFTSGGTEGINWLIRGLLAEHPRGSLLTSDLEHAAVFNTAKELEAAGRRVYFISPGMQGAATVESVRAALKPDVCALVLMAANNETGVKTDLAGIAALTEEAGIPFLVDGVSLLGKESFTIPSGVSAMCFSGHKFHALKGTGFCFVRRSLRTRALITGGPQEYNKRGGTENTAGAASLAKAIDLLRSELPEASGRMNRLRDLLERSILTEVPDVFVNGWGPRIVNTSNLAFLGVEGETLLAALDREGIAVSHGSACASGAIEPSRVLLRMGLPIELARSSLRFSLSRFTTEEEVHRTVETVSRLVKKMRR